MKAWKHIRVAYLGRHQAISIIGALFYLFTDVVAYDTSAAPNCGTALGRIARVATERAVLENQQTACKGFKRGALAIDKTKALELKKFELCENGAVVTARIDVRVECATSDAALIRTSATDTLSAQASANLETCTVSDTRVSASGFLANVGLDWANADRKLKEAAEREIKPYCTE